jgi:hypothetical protein
MHRKYMQFLGVLLITLLLLIFYVGSFYRVRRMVTFTTAMPVDFSGRTVISVYYFSKDKRSNRLLFLFYYPMHLHSPANFKDLDSSPPPYVHYVEDTTVLEQAGAIGF